MQSLREALFRRSEEPASSTSTTTTDGSSSPASSSSSAPHTGKEQDAKHKPHAQDDGTHAQSPKKATPRAKAVQQEQRSRSSSLSAMWRRTIGSSERTEQEVARTLLSLNPFTEVQLLIPDSASVTKLLKLDDHRLLSVSENTAQVWSTDHAQLLSTLQSHTRPITCAAMVHKTVVTASHDETIRLWDPSCGECRNTISVPDDVIRVLAPVNDTTFCCGGQQLYVFSCHGKLVAKAPQENPDLAFHTLLVLRRNQTILGVVTDSHQIWEIALDGEGTLAPYVSGDHREHGSILKPRQLKRDHERPITCLAEITENLFASGCKDGSVFLWLARSLTLCKVLVNAPEVFYDEATKLYTRSVNFILPLPNQHAAIALKNGFLVVSIQDRTVCAEVEDAHLGEIHKMALIHNGHFLLTCSSDAVKLWCISQFALNAAPRSGEQMCKLLVQSLSTAENPPPGQQHTTHDTGALPRPLRKNMGTLDPHRPLCIGEMKVHADPIADCETISSYMFATCSSEQMICLWKNGAYSWRNANLLATRELKDSFRF
ncbi:hypothetical protein PTSG_05042 [Salpingoeca rosetta]|uniref:Uncharacterized protein n=1 Tax=Salpingoeca rosetta (strain ATCC 50818 / BSB-021) TaxID=946362 RepID=F2U9C7_SALR5|nr:uncharacterized protein PTSG_05042 [Salpingoeca rosetta]EGD73330.1 hypothetical protein PTSG_05042 [Salpingoeca rosetta]|eukprot:XP_004994360.1 hypothetical protein PTSG_05042 [Salpingoeca rosetta]